MMLTSVSTTELSTALAQLLRSVKAQNGALRSWPDYQVDRLAYDLSKRLQQEYVITLRGGSSPKRELPSRATKIVEGCLTSAKRMNDSTLTRTTIRYLERFILTILATTYQFSSRPSDP